MPPELISSRRNPLVRRLRQLHAGKGRRELQLVLLEGTHLLQEAVRLSLQPIDLLATQAWLETHRNWLASQPLPLRPVPVTTEVLAAVATTEHPDGVVLTLPMPGQSWGPPVPSLVLALDRLQDPGNLGTLMRTALASGVEALWLLEGADPFQPKVLRASAGAALALPLQRCSRAQLLARLQELGAVAADHPGQAPQVVAAVPPGPAALPYWQLDWQRPTVLLLGQEGSGLAPELLACASHCVTIPHSPAVESLNVAVAAAPLLLERQRQRLTA